MSGRSTKLLIAILLVWALSSTWLYLNSVLTPRCEETEVIRVNLGINYGNGTLVWYNSTELNLRTNLLDATKRVAEVNCTIYAGMGCFVESINGVKNEHPRYWIWWYWDRSMGWTLGPVAADKYLLSDGETVMWFYEDTSQYPPPKP